MTPYHPASNGLVERLHRTLKAAIMCHADDQWTETLPLVLLGIRSAFKEDLNASAAELVYGEPLRIPGEFLMPTTRTVDPQPFMQRLHRRINDLRPTPAARCTTQTSFIQRDLKDSTHVFLRQETARRALQPPYSGPQKVIARTDKTFKIVVRGRQVTLSIDRLKPAYTLEEELHGNKNTRQPVPSILASPHRITRSGRRVHFPDRFVS
jgi:cleavage and polyadenylation specificity factor subunit 1